MSDPILSDLIAYLGESPTPFHAVASAGARLAAAGFVPLSEGQSWSALAPGRYTFAHGDSSLLAFAIPRGRPIRGFRIVGAHTDSPNLRLKPKPEYSKEGYAQLGVEVYGGALLNSWLDRDLSLAGRVLIHGEGGKIKARLVRIDRPLVRVPQLAIHLDRDVNDKGIALNRQEHLAPVIGLGSDGADLHALIAAELGIDRGTIVATDLMLFDITPPTIAGRSNEFVFSARLDNQAMCHAGISALIAAAPLVDDRDLAPVCALFDHEEVGSQTAYGAESAFLARALERISLGTGATQDDHYRALAGSLCVSADMAHAVHPNYVERHEPRHRPQLNGGPVIKVNAQQRYATSATTAALFAALCRAAEVPVQHYAHRTDLPCGTTIGPITATQLGIRTVDVGNPMLSMHSSREMSGSKDPALMTRVLTAFYGCPDPD